MLAIRRSYSRMVPSGKRQFSSQFAKRNELKPTNNKLPPAPKPSQPIVTPIAVKTEIPKKSHPFRTFFIRLGLFTSLVYAGGIAASLKNDTIYDNFVDYFPLGEELIEFTENYIINYSSQSRVPTKESSNSFNDILDKTVKVSKGGITSIKIDEKELSALENETKRVAKSAEVPPASANITPETPLPLIDFQTQDPTLKKAIDALNDIIKAHNAKKPAHVSVVSEISNAIHDLSNRLNQISTDKVEVVDNIASQEKEVELTKTFVQQMEAEKKAVEQKYQEIMLKEIESTTNKIFSQADNKIESSRLQALNEFNRVISDKIESERNGRLSKLDDIFKKISSLEEFEIEMSKQVTNFLILKKLKTEIAKVNSLLADSSRPVILNDHFDNLEKLCTELNDEVISESVKQLPKSGNLLTKQQLISRWKLLVPELKAASFLPPNAGILGHFASRVFSKFLFSKDGFAEGNDIESVIARVNGYLERDELDLAVEQVTSLKGWSRKLANDWILESRKRLEVEFLVNLINYETRLLA